MSAEAITPHRWQTWLCAFAALAGALWLAMSVDRIGAWPDHMSAVSGRALLRHEGLADPSTLLAAYPPIPYIMASLASLVAVPLGLNPLVVASAGIAASFIALYAAALRRARYGPMAIVAFALILFLNPLTLHAIASGPEALLLMLGIWMLGHGMFGFRATSGVNDLILFVLSLPLLALTGLHGLMLAVAAIPFLLLGVPEQLVQRSYGSVYFVLLFPLLFAIFAVGFIGWVLLHDPLAPLAADALERVGWPQPVWKVAAGAIAAGLGIMAAAIGILLRSLGRRPLSGPAAALIGTLLLGILLFVLAGLEEDLLHGLAPAVAAVAVVTVRWPAGQGRFVRSFGLAMLALATGLLVTMLPPHDRRPALAQIVRGAADPDGTVALGRFLRSRSDIMIDAVAHPELVSSRGSAAGLVTGRMPRFQLDLLGRDISAAHIVVARHAPGISDDAVSRAFAGLYEQGWPGYRLAYDGNGWRVWSRAQGMTGR